MEYEIYPCSKELLPFVQHYWVLDIGKEDVPYQQQILPYGHLELFFIIEEPRDTIETRRFSGSQKISSYIAGMADRIQKVVYSSPVRVVGISFQPWAGSFLYNIPANELVSPCNTYSDFESFSSISDQLSEDHSVQNTLELFENFLKSKIHLYRGDEMIEFITKSILKSDGHENAYRDLNLHFNLSKRRIEQRFLAAVGVPMGAFSRITRVEKAFQVISEGNYMSMTELGAELGFYDQSHFIREFKQYASDSPKSFAHKLVGLNDAEKRLTLF